MTTKPDVSAVIERGARRIACLALTHQGHQIAHLVVDEHPDLSDATDDDLIALCRDYATWMSDRMDECSHLVDDFVTYVLDHRDHLYHQLICAHCDAPLPALHIADEEQMAWGPASAARFCSTRCCEDAAESAGEAKAAAWRGESPATR